MISSKWWDGGVLRSGAFASMPWRGAKRAIERQTGGDVEIGCVV